MPKRWCMDCKALYDADATRTLRCPACQAIATQKRNARPGSSSRGLGWAWSRRKAASPQYTQATHCQCPGCPRHTGLCGQPFTPDNPKNGGHVTPRSRGGGSGAFRAVCLLCNSSDGGRLAHRQ